MHAPALGRVAGAGCANYNLLFERAARSVYSVVGTNSKGGYVAVTLKEGPFLGFSDVRAAIQAFQLAVHQLIWQMRSPRSLLRLVSR